MIDEGDTPEQVGEPLCYTIPNYLKARPNIFRSTGFEFSSLHMETHISSQSPEPYAMKLSIEIGKLTEMETLGYM